MPLALYTATTNWIDETPHVINSLTVVEIGEDKKGYSAASRRGRGRGRGGRGRGQQRGNGGPSDEHDVPTGWRHMHAMLEINSRLRYSFESNFQRHASAVYARDITFLHQRIWIWSNA